MFTLVDSSVNVVLTESTITRLIVQINLTNLQTVQNQIEYTAGMVTANERAVGVGITALPDPASPGGIDWLWWRGGNLLPIAAETTGAFRFLYSASVEMDLRSQRKLIENNTDLVLLIGNEDGTLAFTAFVTASILLKLM